MEILRINETHPSAYNQKYLVFLFGWHRLSYTTSESLAGPRFS